MLKLKLIPVVLLFSFALISASAIFAIIHVNADVIVGVVEPINPTTISINHTCYISYPGVCGSGPVFCNNLTIINNGETSYETNITYEETYSEGPPGTFNTPFTQILHPGANYVYVCWTSNCFTGGLIEGNYHITRIP